MAAETKTASWARLNDGTWGLRVQGEAVEGEVVKATTKGGKTTYETMGKIISTYTYNGFAYVLATQGPKPTKVKKGSKKRTVNQALLQKATDEHTDYGTAEEIYGSSNDLPY
jgi:hypothetical protein